MAVCRVCWKYIELTPDRVNMVEGRAFYQCQLCGGAFLIRWEDAKALNASALVMSDASTTAIDCTSMRPPGVRYRLPATVERST